jgi:hypothetical protein
MTTENEADASDKVRRAFERINSIRQNLPEGHIDEPFVQEYSDALHDLRDAGCDIKQFEIPQDWFERRAVGSSPYTPTTYAKHRSVNRDLFLTKLDAVLGYFARSKEKIGFTGPKL